MASLTFHKITKRYQEVKAVVDFSLHVADQEFLVIVGPSGCGKSTILRMIAGLEEISEGELYMDERLMNHIPSADRDIAMVFQSSALYPHLSVYDNMAMGLKRKQLSKKKSISGFVKLLKF